MNLLEVRKALKAKKPNFLREDYDKKSLGRKWRRPTGRHSKIKHQFKGNRKMPSSGYQSPVLVRGLTRSGHVPFVVHSMSDIEQIGTKHATIIGRTVGKRLRAMMLKRIIEKKLIVHNVKDAAKTLKMIEDSITKKPKAVPAEAPAANPAATKQQELQKAGDNK